MDVKVLRGAADGVSDHFFGGGEYESLCWF